MRFIPFILLLSILSLLSTFTSADSQTAITDTNELRIDLIRFDPTPVYTGQDTDVWFEVTNLKDTELKDYTLTLIDVFPFTTTNPTLTIARLAPGKKQTVKFHLSSNKDVQEGTYKIGLQFYSHVYQAYSTRSFTVDLKHSQAAVTTTRVTVTPEHIEPGKEATISVTIHNAANAAISDVSVKLGINNASVPFAPIESTAEQQIKSISPGTEQTATFHIVVLPGATANVYKVPLSLHYYDEYNKQITQDDTVGIFVNAPIAYQFDLDETTIHTPETNGKIIVSISNRGSSDIKYLTIRLLDNPAYDLLSKSRIYIGNIQPDDSQTASFTIYAKKQAPLLFQITYKDIYNTDYTDVQTLNLPLYTTSQATRYGFIQNSHLVSLLIDLLLIAFAINLILPWIRMKSFKKAFVHAIFTIFSTLIDFIRALRPKHIKQAYRDFKTQK